MKNPFCFIFKYIFVLKKFKVLFLRNLNFYPDFSGHVGKLFDNKAKVNFLKFMTSQPGKQAVAIHIMPNISGSKGNQIIWSVKTWEIVSSKIMQKWGRETSSRHFLFFKKALYMRQKNTLVSIHFDSPRLRHTIKTNCIKL